MDTPLLLDAEEVARLLRVGRSTIYQMLSDGRLHGVRIGRSRRFARREVEELVEKLQSGDTPALTR